MINVPVAHNEAQRLEALRQYDILDTPPEKAFDDIASMAALACETSMALITLTDVHREWVKAQIGLKVPNEIPREAGFSSYTIRQREVFIVRDALADQRFANNPLVASGPKVRFYAGSPLVTSEGYPLGAISVFGYTPRELDAKQKKILSLLASQSVTMMDWRWRMNTASRTEKQRHDAASSSQHSFLQPRRATVANISAGQSLPQLIVYKSKFGNVAESFKNEILKDAGYALLREAGYIVQEDDMSFGNSLDFYEELSRFEIKMIEYALNQTGGKQKLAALLLNLNANTLSAKIKQYKIAARSFSHRGMTS